MSKRTQNVDANRSIRRRELLENLSPRAQRSQVRQVTEPELEESDANESQENMTEPEAPTAFALASTQENPGDTTCYARSAGLKL